VIACAVYNIWIALRSKAQGVLRLGEVKLVLLGLIVRVERRIRVKSFISRG
jgi:hypothetical protein